MNVLRNTDKKVAAGYKVIVMLAALLSVLLLGLPGFAFAQDTLSTKPSGIEAGPPPDPFVEQFFDDEDRDFLEDRPGGAGQLQPDAGGFGNPTAIQNDAVRVADDQQPALARNWYSIGGWSTLHQGPGNRDQARGATLHDSYRSWRALEGMALMIAPSVSPGKTRFYQTSGLAKGNSNLHALSMQGEILWQSPAWTSATEGVDPCAVLSNVIVDAEGDLYLGDCNQMFSFDAEGRQKWVVPLPAPQEGDWQPVADLPINALTTPVFTTQGDVLGVTNFGDVVVWDRATGEVLSQPMRLPGLLSPRSTAVPQPETMWANGMMDPDIKEWSWQLLFGGEMRSMNTPAVSQETGRVFVAATSTEPELGRLYGLDLIETDQGIVIDIAFATDFGIGSGSSPATSNDDNYVYVSDEDGYVYSIDAFSGAIAWKSKTFATAGSAVVDMDGTVIVLQAWPNATMMALDGDTGDLKWESDISDLAKETLPSHWLLGDAQGSGNGIPTVTEDAILVPIAYGYKFWVGRTLVVPVKNYVVAFDKETGVAFRNVVEIPDDSSNTTPVLANGIIMSPMGGSMTSGFAPLSKVTNWFMPDGLEQVQPVGGLQVAIPE